MPGTGRQWCSAHPAPGVEVNAGRTEEEALRRGRGCRRRRRIVGTSRRSQDPALTKSAVRDLRSLPLTTKSDRRTAHSRSVSGDEHGRGPSRSSRSLSDHGRSSQGRRSRSGEPTPPQLMNFNIDDFTVVSHTTDSFTFTSAHPFFPGWVRVVSAHREEMPDADSAVPQSPVSGNVPSARGLPLGTRSWIHGIFCRSFRWKRVGGPTRPSGGRGSGGPAETLLFVSSPSLLSASFSSVLREGVPRGTRGGDTPPAFSSLWQLGQLVQRTRRRYVHGQNVPLGTSVDTTAPPWEWLATLKAKWNGQRERSRDFLPWSHWSSIRSRRNRRGSCPTGSDVSPRPCTRIASWELSMTAQRGALDSLRKDDKQSGTHEERGPDVKI